MNPSKEQSFQKAMENGIFDKGNIAALVEVSRSFHQRYGEMPEIDISEGALKGHHQVEIAFFERDNGLNVSFSLDDEFLDIKNTKTGTTSSIDFKQIYLERAVTDTEDVTFSIVNVSEGSAKKFPDLAKRLSNLRIIQGDKPSKVISALNDNNDNSVWVPEKEVDTLYFIREIIGGSDLRQDFLNEFKLNTENKTPKKDISLSELSM
jgi:hypothetical protein